MYAWTTFVLLLAAAVANTDVAPATEKPEPEIVLQVRELMLI